MKKVITYGTYDYLHRGHIRLLERARALGDYLVVGVTAADFDKVRGKINVGQSLMDRVENRPQDWSCGRDHHRGVRGAKDRRHQAPRDRRVHGGV